MLKSISIALMFLAFVAITSCSKINSLIDGTKYMCTGETRALGQTTKWTELAMHIKNNEISFSDNPLFLMPKGKVCKDGDMVIDFEGESCNLVESIQVSNRIYGGFNKVTSKLMVITEAGPVNKREIHSEGLFRCKEVNS
jgi:hypothetical protein